MDSVIQELENGSQFSQVLSVVSWKKEIESRCMGLKLCIEAWCTASSPLGYIKKINKNTLSLDDTFPTLFLDFSTFSNMVCSMHPIHLFLCKNIPVKTQYSCVFTRFFLKENAFHQVDWSLKIICLEQLLFKLQLAGLWEEKLKEEQTKTGPLEEVCAALREALDAEHKKRMEAFESKMKPIIIKDGPSRKATISTFQF